MPAIPAVQDAPVRAPLPRQWSLCRAGTDRLLPATVPGCNFTDLLAAGAIPDPFVSDNYRGLQWIGESDWEYRTVFALEDGTETAHVDLVFDGLDTFATVRLNGEVVLEANNMFRRYRVRCAGRLRPGANELSIAFRSPLAEARPQHARDGFSYPAENDAADEKLSVYARKAAYHYGWDWAPRLVSSGIWRPAYLEVVPHCRIADAMMTIEQLDENQATLNFAVEIDAREPIEGVLSVSCDDSVVAELPVAMQPGRDTARVTVVIDRPRRWWPRGLGEAHLYPFRFEVLSGEKTLAVMHRRFGLRTVEFVNEPDEHGRSFYFRVNGIPVFVRGANYIPPDMFPNRVDDARYRRIFADVTEASINMLRVWGGGVYESSAFYDLADEHGVLVWQDFMFANTMYPGDDEFVANVGAEVTDVVRRLRHHACLALWCGNNEIDMGIECWKWQEKFGYSDARFEKLVSGNQRLFREFIPELIAEHDPGRADCYLPSSPQSFWERPSTAGQGNGHYWGVWHGGEDFSAYRDNVPRFMTEFGFQSFPGPVTVGRYARPEDRHLDSEVMRAHQRHATGNRRIADGIERYFGVQPGFDHLLYLSQVLQAEGMRVGIEAHRSARPYCMGTMYWQLNDAWPGASWSGIDYFGQWKALHYEVRRSFEPTIPILDGDDESMSALVVNDRRAPCTLRLDIAVRRFSGETVASARVESEVAAGAVQEVWRVRTPEFTGGTPLADCVLMATLRGDGVNVTRMHYFSETRDQPLADPGLVADVVDGEDGQYVRLRATRSLARFVRVSVASDDIVNFSDNFFDLLPGEAVEVAPRTDRKIRPSEPRVVSLFDALQGR